MTQLNELSEPYQSIIGGLMDELINYKYDVILKNTAYLPFHYAAGLEIWMNHFHLCNVFVDGDCFMVYNSILIIQGELNDRIFSYLDHECVSKLLELVQQLNNLIKGN